MANGETGKQSPWIGKSQIFDMAPDPHVLIIINQRDVPEYRR